MPRLHAERDVIDIMTVVSRPGAAQAPERAVHCDQIDHHRPKPQMMKAKLVASPIPGAAEYIDIESADPVDVSYPEHDVIDR